MSKKIILFGTALLLLLAGLFFPHSAPDQPAPVVHQHLSAPKESPETAGFDENGVLTSHLPLVILHADGNVIPGVNREDSRRLTCSYTIIDHKNGVNRSTDAPTMEGLADINIRGNSSREFPKKQYGFRLVDSQGEPAPASVMGMPEGSAWVLNGSWIDRSMLRNYMMYNICGEFMPYSPRVRFCEVFVTNADKEPVYQGVYTMMEKIRVEEDRVRLSDYDPKYAAAPFLVQLNSHIDHDPIRRLYSEHERPSIFDLEYPKSDEITPESLRYIEQNLLTLDKLLLDSTKSRDWSWLEDTLDLDSFVDYFLVNEFFQNYDAARRSTYMYRDLDGKYHMGPVWDFDGICNNYIGIQFPLSELTITRQFYYVQLTQSPEFLARCITRYGALRDSWLSDEYLLNYIDQAAAYLDGPGRRNSLLWYQNENEFLTDTAKMKEYIVQRGAWLDENYVRCSTLIE